MKRIGFVLAGFSAAAMLTACGSGDDDKSDNGFADKSADDIVAAAKADMGDLTSVRIDGSIDSEGQTTELDLQASSEGNCTGSIGVAGGTTEVRGLDGTTWIKADENFWRASAGAGAEQIITAVGDKWVVMPEGDDSFSSFCDVDELIGSMFDDDESDGNYSKDGTEEVDGKSTLKIDNTDANQEVSSAYVLADAPHYLVKLEKTEGADLGSMNFSKFDETFDVEAPADEDVIDLATLGS